MKNNTIGGVLLGLLLGVVLGLGASTLLNRPGHAKGSDFLRGFSLVAVATDAGHTDWEILEDRTYDPFPPLARSQRIARRMVARAFMPNEESERFSRQFQHAVNKALDDSGAINKAHFDLMQERTRSINDGQVFSRLDLPRRYYSIGDVHGVADTWVIADSGSVTVIVSLIEGE